MALIPHAQLDELVRDAVALDLGDLSRRAEHLQQEARLQAQRTLEDALAERARILEGAQEQGRAEGHAEGFQDGLTEGREQGRAEVLAQLGPQIESLLEAWSGALDQFDAARDVMLSEARTDVVRLGLAIAEKITLRVIEIDPEVVARQLEHLLGLLTKPTRLRVLVHPDDAGCVRDALPALLDRFEHATHAEVCPDGSLTRGSVITRSESGGVLDASIKTQLDRLVEEVLPCEAGESGAGV